MSKEITWTNCAEQMPPDDETEILIRPINDNSELILSPAIEVFYDIDAVYKDMWEWTEFTKEKWEELNK